MKTSLKTAAASIALRLTDLSVAKRIFAIALISALLAPVILINLGQKVSAGSNRSRRVQETAPPSAPPEPFIMTPGDSSTPFMTASLVALSGVFSAPKAPEGLEIAKVPTFGSKLTSYLGSFFGLFTGSSAKSTATEATPPPPAQPPASVDFDFDNDGKTDMGRWHPSTTEMKVKNSNGGSYATFIVGSTSSKSAPGDFNGDDKTDAAVFLNGTWKYKTSTGSSEQTVNWGMTGDIPVAGDYDGDDITDFAIFRPSTGYWWVLKSSDSSYTGTSFGTSSDTMVQGDYDGDGKTDPAFYRPSTGDWHIYGSTSGYYSAHWGIAVDVAVPADYDGDGKTDMAVFRPTTGDWYAYKSSTNNGTYLTANWGNYGDQPVPGDYDGDSKADFAVWRPTTGVWYIIKSSDSGYMSDILGIAGDTAVPSSYIKQIGSPAIGYDLNTERLSPKNATGSTNLYSRNFSWNTSLVGLPGRSGLDAGFGMSYNSLVWIKQGSSMIFDPDNSNITPGFRFGFPVIEPVYYDTAKSKYGYMMVTPSGGRVEFSQTAVGNTYETADSSYAQLVTTGASSPSDPAESITIKVTSTNGTQMSYEWVSGAFRCKQIKDRNGNYITIAYNGYGDMTTVTDTLGRVITVNYSGEKTPSSITQTWKDSNGSGSNVTHTWASFTYTTMQIDTNFGSLNIFGPQDGTTIQVLQRVTRTDGSYTTFDYNTWGQVKQINNYAPDAHKLNHAAVNLPANASSSESDCPRFTETKSYVENFNGGSEVTFNNSITTGQTYSLPGSISGSATKIQTWMTGHPDDLRTNTFVGGSGWNEGLPIATEDCITTSSTCSDRKRWTWSSWTQDNTGVAYPLNPRVVESRVGDASNTKRTTVDYRTVSSVVTYGLAETVKTYDTDLSTVLKQSYTEYNLDSAYTSRRIIGLVSKTEISGRDSSGLNLTAKTTYAYDEGNFSDSGLAQNISPVQHDSTNYSSSFVTGRGNLTSATRWDAEYPTTSGYAVTSSAKYNTAGSIVSDTDPMSRVIKISYTDSFNSTVSGSTYAYPTTLTDPANNSSTIKYRYDIGAKIEAVSPAPAGNTYGKKSRSFYDNVGRLEKESTGVETSGGGYAEHTYTRYGRPTTDNGIQVFQYTPIIDADGDGNLGEDEVTTETLLDGAGRVRMSRSEHPGSTGGYTGKKIEYNALGQVKRQSVPTEIDSSWNAAGDDYTRGFLWTYQKYDWKGRVVRKINTDGIDQTTLNDSDVIISYEGCGCAGGQVTTIEGENIIENNWAGTSPSTLGRRKQKVYEDIQGRAIKTEIYMWNGTDVYSTTIDTFNGRDQKTNTRQYWGDTSSGTYRDLTMTYDGFGRMKTRHYPIEDTSAYTSWTYNSDDSINTTTDPRGVVTTFSYGSNTGLMTGIAYTVPGGLSNVADTPDVAFTYDNLGNRTQMTDGTGSRSYSYNALSRMTSETQTITGLSGSFTINYTYNLSGGLKSISDPQDSTRKVIYDHDKTGRVTTADMLEGSTSTEWVHDSKYRAWGDLKEITFKAQPSTSLQAAYKFTYDNALRISNYETEWNSQTSLSVDFVRYADGNVRKAVNGSMYLADYSYKFDYLGRLVQGLSARDAHDGDTNMNQGPFKQDLTYTGFSEVVSITGKNWGVTIHALAKSYANYTGRDANTGYDAAGNVVTDRIQTLPTVFNRSLKYDAAGRQVEMYDPALHSCCETNMTYKSYYDGNGWQVKKEDISSSTTTTTYDLRSTVLAGEKVGELLPHTNPNTKFIAPVLGGQLTYTSLGGGYSVSTGYTREAPEGYGYDPRGAPVGEEPGTKTNLTGGGDGYPGFPDASNPNRCSWAGIAMSCDMSDRLNQNDRQEAAIIRQGGMMRAQWQVGRDQKVIATFRKSLIYVKTETSKKFDDLTVGKTVSTASQPFDEAAEDDDGNGDGDGDGDDEIIKINTWTFGDFGDSARFVQRNGGGGGGRGNPTHCSVFVGLIVSAVEQRKNWTAAKVQIGSYLAVLTHQYLQIETKYSPTGFKAELTSGGQDSDVFRHITGSAASILLDGVGLASTGDSIRQEIVIWWNGSESTRGAEAKASQAGNSAGEAVGSLISQRISNTITALDLQNRISDYLCDKDPK